MKWPQEYGAYFVDESSVLGSGAFAKVFEVGKNFSLNFELKLDLFALGSSQYRPNQKLCNKKN